ncbi:MAG: methyltransferase domain-containing protein [Acidobacteriota bacterium]
MNNFTCNLCGTSNTVEEIPWETATCSDCGSNVRMRALIYMLALELFGKPRLLPEFPRYDNVKGFGMSDAQCYSTTLAEKMNYTNTFYDRQPYLDITESHADQHGTYDFILSSDVFEHVAPPIERAFEEAFSLLKPYGFLCITVPSVIADETDEHYPDLHQYSVIELAGEHVLINRKKDRTLEIHGNLVFHGGIGATLEMRLFAQADLVRKLRAAGFSDVVLQMEPVERFGIVFDGPWSRPLVARKQPFPKLSASAPAENVNQGVARVEPQTMSGPDAIDPIAQLQKEKAEIESRLDLAETQLRLAGGSRWLRLGRRLGLGPNLEQDK